MREALYPVPQGLPPVVRPSRLLVVTAATAVPAGFMSLEILRGRGGAQRGTVPDPTARRRSFFFGLPQVVPAAGTGSGLLLSDHRNRLVRGG